MRLSYIENIPESITENIKRNVAFVSNMMKDKYNVVIDEGTTRELYNQFRQAAMEGVVVGSYILTNIQKDISSALINIQFEK